MTLVATAYINMERGKSCEITNMIRVKGVRKEPFIFIFRFNIVLRNSYQANEIVMEIEEWKQKVPDDYVKYTDVLRTNIVLPFLIWE